MRRISETEETPAFEIHLGEVFSDGPEGPELRPVIVWINGKRWEGELQLGEPGT